MNKPLTDEQVARLNQFHTDLVMRAVKNLFDDPRSTLEDAMAQTRAEWLAAGKAVPLYGFSNG